MITPNSQFQPEPASQMRKCSVRFTTIRRIFLCITISYIANSASLSGGPPSTRTFPADPRALLRIRDPETNEIDFLQATRQLGYLPAEETSVWARIVADPKYSARRRKLALLELLTRHVKSRMTLFELAQLIPKNTLLNEEVMPPMTSTGYGPPDLWVRFKISSVYTVGIEQFRDGYSGPLICIVLNVPEIESGNKIDWLRAALRGEQSDELKAIRVLDLAGFGNWINPVPINP